EPVTIRARTLWRWLSSPSLGSRRHCACACACLGPDLSCSGSCLQLPALAFRRSIFLRTAMLPLMSAMRLPHFHLHVSSLPQALFRWLVRRAYCYSYSFCSLGRPIC